MHLAAQRLDNLIAVVAVDDGIAEAQLVGVVELWREGNVDTLLREKLFKAAYEHLRLRDLAAFELFPVFHIQDGIARDLLVRAFAKAELGKKALNGGALSGVKVQQRAIHVPQNRFDHSGISQNSQNYSLSACAARTSYHGGTIPAMSIFRRLQKRPRRDRIETTILRERNIFL